MATSLYEVLQIDSSASPEQVRKAYKKRALQTHPDRLPPGATADEKARSEEEFRKVNNAYEVLIDPQKRRTYDMQGVWPPPEQVRPDTFGRRSTHSTTRFPTNGDPFDHPFFKSGFSFTDPFELFDSIFYDSRPRHRSQHRGFPSENPFDRITQMHANMSNLFRSLERDMFSDFGGGSSSFPSLTTGPSSRFNNPGDRPGIQWVSQSTMSQTINGVTHTIEKRRDWDGNEHVTKSYPDGRKVYTINGVEQPQQGYLPSPSNQPPPPQLPPLPAPPAQNGGANYIMPPPPPYSRHDRGYNPSPQPEQHPSHSHYRRKKHRSDAPRPRYDIYAPAPGQAPAPTPVPATPAVPAVHNQEPAHHKSWWRRH